MGGWNFFPPCMFIMACSFIKEFRVVALKAVAPVHVAFCHKGVSDSKAHLNYKYHHARNYEITFFVFLPKQHDPRSSSMLFKTNGRGNLNFTSFLCGDMYNPEELLNQRRLYFVKLNHMHIRLVLNSKKKCLLTNKLKWWLLRFMIFRVQFDTVFKC